MLCRPRRPANHLPREQIEHHSQKEKSLVGPDVGNVRHPDLVRGLGGELACQHVVGHRAGRTAQRTWALAVAHHRAKPFLLHQPLHTMPAARLAQLAQIPGDLAMPVDRAALQPSMLDQAQQTLVLTSTSARRQTLPRVVPATLHTQHAAHRHQTEIRGVLLHERVLRLHPLAKYAAAFFRMSRSSVTRRSSASRRRTSAF